MVEEIPEGKRIWMTVPLDSMTCDQLGTVTEWLNTEKLKLQREKPTDVTRTVIKEYDQYLKGLQKVMKKNKCNV